MNNHKVMIIINYTEPTGVYNDVQPFKFRLKMMLKITQGKVFGYMENQFSI